MSFFSEFTLAHVFMISAVLLAVVAVEFVYTLMAPASDGRKHINRRMSAGNEESVSQKDILVQLRKERGMDADGNWVLPTVWLNRLIVQAGITIGLKRVGLYYLIYVFMALFCVFFFTRSVLLLGGAFPVVTIALPLLWLRHRRSKKMNDFGNQLPEAIDLITRSLKAGHPVPVAISMVAREMPDPIGSEFGLVVDEITYGSDLVTALFDLYERVGHPDLPLLVAAVSIQSTTGGNLREILEGLSNVIRERQKMKRKVKAISAEGRMSAMFLTAMPVILFGVLMLLMPSYYGGIWHFQETWVGFGILGFWLTTGNILILKMVSFKV